MLYTSAYLDLTFSQNLKVFINDFADVSDWRLINNSNQAFTLTKAPSFTAFFREVACDCFLRSFQNGTRNLQSYFWKILVQKLLVFQFDYASVRRTG